MPSNDQLAESIAVLGGGMLGLTLALRLARRGFDVSLIEAADVMGGLTQFTTTEGVTWDRFYHVIDGSDHALLGLLNELGLADDVTWSKTNTLFFDGRRHYPLNDAFDYLRLPTLSWADKFRVGVNILYAGSRRRRGQLESISARQWLSRWSGQHAYEALWAPLLRSKLGANYDNVSAAYIWSVIRRFYGAREGHKRTERFGFMPGGYARIIAALCAALKDRGVTCITGSPVQRIDADKGAGIGINCADQSLRFDRAIATFAGPLLSHLCQTLPESERLRHAALKYQGVVCLSMLIERPLGGAYMTYITDISIPFTTVIEMSALTGISHFGGKHLVYLPRYLPQGDALFDASDEAIKDQFIAGLKCLYPDFRTSQIAAWHIARAPYVMAVPTLNYSAALPALETSISGLYVCNSARIVDASLSVNEAVVLADKTVAEITAHDT